MVIEMSVRVSNKHGRCSFDLDIEPDYYSKTFGFMIGNLEKSPGNNAMISLPDAR